MNKKTKKIFSILILIVILVFFVFYLKNNYQNFQQLKLVSPYLLIILIALFLFNYFLIGIVTLNLLLPLGVKLGLKESFMISIVTGFYNLIMPFRGGMFARGVYLKKKYNFSYTNFFSTLAASYILIFLVASVVGIISTLIIYYQTGIFSWILFLIFSGVFIPMLLIVIFAPKFPYAKSEFINKFIKVVNGWHLIKNNTKVISIVIIISLSQLLLSSLALFLQFRVFGIDISYFSCLFLSCIGSLSLLIQLTPANLGVSEAIIVFSALTIGITSYQSLTAALLGRAVSFLVLLILGPIFSYVLIKHEPEMQEKTKNL